MPVIVSAGLLSSISLLGSVSYPLRDMNTTPVGSNPEGIIELGGVGYFSATGRGLGAELWRSDGTPAGTALVLDINPGAGPSSPSSLTRVGSRLFFQADDGAHGR